MVDFDKFLITLLDESIRFYEKGTGEESEDGKRAYLHASLLLGMSSLEAFLNSIADDLLSRPDGLPIIEQGLIAEKEVKLVNGKFQLTEQLKISRTTDRIEYLYRKFSGKSIKDHNPMWSELIQGMKLRNDLVHPKATQDITVNQVKKTLQAIIDTINILSYSIYKKNIPFTQRGLTSTMTF